VAHNILIGRGSDDRVRGPIEPMRNGTRPDSPTTSEFHRPGRTAPCIRMMEDNHLLADCVDLPGVDPALLM